MNKETYFSKLKQQIDAVFKRYPEMPDHRERYPWLTGFLGDPFSGIWFVAENPSLSGVERIANRNLKQITEEAQWSISPGDKLLRKMLAKHGFKQNDLFSPGGWECYITDVIKETDYVKHWRDKSQAVRNQAAEAWSSVFIWELANSKPRLIVIMGRQAQRLLEHLKIVKQLELPQVEYIEHYSYIGSRAQGILGPMHPIRVKRYNNEFARIAKMFRAMPA